MRSDQNVTGLLSVLDPEKVSMVSGLVDNNRVNGQLCLLSKPPPRN